MQTLEHAIEANKARHTARQAVADCHRQWYDRPDCTCGQCDDEAKDARRYQWRVLHAQRRGTAVLRRDVTGYRVTRYTGKGGFECRVMQFAGGDGSWHFPGGSDASLRSALRRAARNLINHAVAQ